MKLTDFLTTLAYGTAIVIVDNNTDKELLNTTNFRVPYSLSNCSKDPFDYKLVATGIAFRSPTVPMLIVYVE